MKITSLSAFAPCFTSKNKDIRKADDIQRKSRLAFPVVSATYVDEFYTSEKRNSPYREQVSDISNNIQNKIEAMREITSVPEYYLPNIPDLEKKTLHAILLNCLKKLRMGNCEECAKASLATLFANGYYNSERVNLFYEVDLVNKKTNEKIHAAKASLNHSFVLTDMNSGGEKNIVIDSWLGFADSIEGARARLKVLCEDDIHECNHVLPRYYMISKLERGEKFSLEDYKVEGHLDFVPADKKVSENEKENLGNYMKMMYDDVLIDKSN